MRPSSLALCLAGSLLVNAWKVILYSGIDCNDNDTDLQYHIAGEGTMPFCDAPTSKMHGINECAFIDNRNNSDREPCDRQFEIFHSFKVIRGEMMVWAAFDDHPNQPDSWRCSNPARLTPLWSNITNKVFEAKEECWHRVWQLKSDGYAGILAREAAPPAEGA